MPEKKRRKREGYAEGDYTLYKVLSAIDFVKSHDPVALLGNANKIAFTTEEEKLWLKMESTKDDIKANCEDLKVLGKGDFKALMKWRTLIREEVCRFHYYQYSLLELSL
jgi:AdoMet-dependent rRNA methyltransferase SPB1